MSWVNDNQPTFFTMELQSGVQQMWPTSESVLREIEEEKQRKLLQVSIDRSLTSSMSCRSPMNQSRFSAAFTPNGRLFSPITTKGHDSLRSIALQYASSFEGNLSEEPSLDQPEIANAISTRPSQSADDATDDTYESSSNGEPSVIGQTVDPKSWLLECISSRWDHTPEDPYSDSKSPLCSKDTQSAELQSNLLSISQMYKPLLSEASENAPGPLFPVIPPRIQRNHQRVPDLSFRCFRRLWRKLKKTRPKKRVSYTAAVYATSVLEYLTRELLDLAGLIAKVKKQKRLTPRHILLAIKGDDEMDTLLKNVIIPAGGVISYVHQALRNTTRKPLATRKKAA